MSNSSLATYRNISSKSSSRNGNKVTRIIVHHMAAVCSAKACCDSHKNSNRSVSATYYIGVNGDIAQGVDESRRPWTSGSSKADNNAICVEVSNSCMGDAHSGKGWLVSDASFNSLVKLCADVCKRNGIKALTFTGNKEKDSLSCHRQWDSTACPGDYLYNKLPELCIKVNAILNPQTELYRVRKSLTDGDSQVGAFSSLDNAKKECNKHFGYSVFDSKGKCVYTRPATVEDARAAQRMAINLDKTNLEYDTDGDGDVDMTDARNILRKAIGVEKK